MNPYEPPAAAVDLEKPGRGASIGLKVGLLLTFQCLALAANSMHQPSLSEPWITAVAALSLAAFPGFLLLPASALGLVPGIVVSELVWALVLWKTNSKR